MHILRGGRGPGVARFGSPRKDIRLVYPDAMLAAGAPKEAIVVSEVGRDAEEVVGVFRGLE